MQTQAIHNRHRGLVKVILLSFCLWGCTISVIGQHQLVLIKKEKVLQRYSEGDRIRYQLNGSNDINRRLILGIYDSLIRTDRDTISVFKIQRVYFDHVTAYNKLGSVLVVGGAGLFIIDQFNTLVVRGDDFSVDDDLTVISASAVLAGLPLMLVKKKYHKIRYPTRLLIVDDQSPFYYHGRTSFFH
jgi:hypothetical protein